MGVGSGATYAHGLFPTTFAESLDANTPADGANAGENGSIVETGFRATNSGDSPVLQAVTRNTASKAATTALMDINRIGFLYALAAMKNDRSRHFVPFRSLYALRREPPLLGDEAPQ